MKKRILLCDGDSKLTAALASLLSRCDMPLECDCIADQKTAQERILNRYYDLIVCDSASVRSGNDLLVFLGDISFPGLIFLLTHQKDSANDDILRKMGAHEVIKKPFSLNWLGRKIELALQNDRNNHLEPLNLISLLQMINLDRKNAMIQVEWDNHISGIYLKQGELVHAETDGLQGEAALMKIIAKAESGRIFVRPFRQKRVHHTIKLNFMEQMMQILRLCDELNHHSQKLDKTDSVSRQSPQEELAGLLCSKVQESEAYRGVFVFNNRGQTLAAHGSEDALDLEELGQQLIDTHYYSSQLSRSAGIGHADLIQIENGFDLSVLMRTIRYPFSSPLHVLVILHPDVDPQTARADLLKLGDECLGHDLPIPGDAVHKASPER